MAWLFGSSASRARAAPARRVGSRQGRAEIEPTRADGPQPARETR